MRGLDRLVPEFQPDSPPMGIESHDVLAGSEGFGNPVSAIATMNLDGLALELELAPMGLAADLEVVGTVHDDVDLSLMGLDVDMAHLLDFNLEFPLMGLDFEVVSDAGDSAVPLIGRDPDLAGR